MIGNISDNPKLLWTYINSKTQDKQSIHSLKNQNGSEAESDFDKAQYLNDQFASAFTNKKLTQYLT